MADIHWHTLTEDEAMSKLSSGKSGITSNEAKGRLEKDGPNELTAQKGTSPLVIFLSQFKRSL